jgi:hypothetical protein
MILHVVGEDDFTPEAARPVEHEQFFLARIRDTDFAAVHSFNEGSRTKLQLERMATGQDTFEGGAQALAHDFSRLHLGSSREGAFFIFELEAGRRDTRVYSLIKYDYREAIEQTEGDEGSLLRRIVHAFIADRRAIQKSALVRVVEGTGELAIAARDRVKVAPDISDYFAAFLDVVRSRSDEELNQQMVEALRSALAEARDDLPEGNVPRALRRAKDVLRDRQEIDDQAIVDAVLAAAGNPDDERVRASLEARVVRKLRSAKLTGLTFRPSRQILRRPPLRRLKTAEGVTLIYPDDADGGVVRRQPRAGGGETITIQTARVTEDEVVRDKTRGAT